MPVEPLVKRVVTFIDGQNLYHATRESFGYTYPNFDVKSLSQKICQTKGWNLTQVRFYTGVPDKSDDSVWNHFWVAKMRVMIWQQVVVFSRSLRYRNQRIKLPDGTDHTFLVGWKRGLTSVSPST
jgi:hypothetical protein